MTDASDLETLVGAGFSLAQALEVVPTNSGAGSVYFIQCGDRGPIKIGYTRNDPHARMKALQTSNPFTLYLRSTIQAGRHIEQQLHRMFSDGRMAGEWFYATPQLASLAGANPTPDL